VHALAGHKLNHDQDDYLAIMAKLVEDYENENVPAPKPVEGIKALKFLLEENNLTADDLGDIIGVNRSIAYRILKGARNLTADHIKKLAARFAVSAGPVSRLTPRSRRQAELHWLADLHPWASSADAELKTLKLFST
jgi:antitoxin component HigA of HigAB toxin-antitoxin module